MKRLLGLAMALALGASAVMAIPAAACHEGCTPGYWKQPHHLDSWGPTGYAPGDDFDTVFGVDMFTPNKTLMDVLWLKGNQDSGKLAGHAVAGLLNASSPGVAYNSVSWVIAKLQAGDKGALEAANELGCPLD